MEPTSVAPLFDSLIGLGLPGIVILGLGWFNVLQYRRNNDLADANVKLVQETTKAMESTASSMNRLSDLLVRGREGV